MILTCSKVNLKSIDIPVEIYIFLFIKEEGKTNNLDCFVLKDPNHKYSNTIFLSSVSSLIGYNNSRHRGKKVLLSRVLAYRFVFLLNWDHFHVQWENLLNIIYM